MGPDLNELVAGIRNDAWMVLHYSPQRTAAQRLRRSQAILKLGLTVRYAFAQSDDFEALLTAVLDGLNPRSDSSRF